MGRKDHKGSLLDLEKLSEQGEDGIEEIETKWNNM
jgi:hypothetical protein